MPFTGSVRALDICQIVQIVQLSRYLAPASSSRPLRGGGTVGAVLQRKEGGRTKERSNAAVQVGRWGEGRGYLQNRGVLELKVHHTGLQNLSGIPGPSA